MPDRAVPSPAWRQGVTSAAVFFLVTILWSVLVRDESLPETVVRAVVTGIAFGGVMALLAHRRQRRTQTVERD